MTDKLLPQNLGLQVLQIVRQDLFPQIPDFQDLNEEVKYFDSSMIHLTASVFLVDILEKSAADIIKVMSRNIT